MYFKNLCVKIDREPHIKGYQMLKPFSLILSLFLISEVCQSAEDNGGIAVGTNLGAQIQLKQSLRNEPVQAWAGISVDFPEPTDIKDIIKFYALTSGKKLILAKGINEKIEIHSPQRVPKVEGLRIIRSALEESGLKVSEDDKTIEISKL